MTDTEARKILIQNMKSLKANPLVTVDDCLYEAFDKAINALEQRDVLEKIRAEINTMPCAITSMREIYVNKDKVINILDKYKTGGRGMTKRYIIDKADIHDLLAGKELSLSQGRESAFCITISGNMTNGDMIKAIFPNEKYKEGLRGDMVDGKPVNHKVVRVNGLFDYYVMDYDWWNAPYEAESEEAE